jgi:hypothetical protein
MTYEEAKQEATHTDENANLYLVIAEQTIQFCVYYYDRRLCGWCQDMGVNFDHLIPIKKAYVTIQCKAPCGTVGCFLYSHKTQKGYHLISPIFSSSLELANYAKEQGWRWSGGLLGWYEKD